MGRCEDGNDRDCQSKKSKLVTTVANFSVPCPLSVLPARAMVDGMSKL